MRRQTSLTRRKRSGFTLVELLVVIVILGLLATILTPTINAILQHVYQADTKQRIHGLDQGANRYKQDLASYPGQEDYNLHSTGGTNYTYTGSQVLGAILFDMREDGAANPYHVLDDGDTTDRPPKGRYAMYESGMLQTVVDNQGNDRYLTIMDCFPRPKPIAYYMAASGIGTLQFHLQQNIVYTQPDGEDLNRHQRNFAELITDTRFPSNYYDPGDSSYRPSVRNEMFLLISPGINGVWFDSDDVRNWNAGG